MYGRHHCPGWLVVIKGRSGAPIVSRSTAGSLCSWCLSVLFLPSRGKKLEEEKILLVGPAQSNFSARPCDQVCQVHRSPSPRSLATACFPLWPQEIVLAPRHTAAFHDSFRLKPSWARPVRDVSLFAYLCTYRPCLTSEARRCANLTCACSPFNASKLHQDHTRRVDQDPAQLPRHRRKETADLLATTTMSGAQYASSGRGVSGIPKHEARLFPRPSSQAHAGNGG